MFEPEKRFKNMRTVGTESHSSYGETSCTRDTYGKCYFQSRNSRIRKPNNWVKSGRGTVTPLVSTREHVDRISLELDSVKRHLETCIGQSIASIEELQPNEYQQQASSRVRLR
jgi:hypothetical protein